MIIRENVPLASLTTLRVGGSSRFLAECETKEDVLEAIVFAHEQSLPWSVLGQGSNVLAYDEGFAGVTILIKIGGIRANDHENKTLVTAGAGVSWDALVQDAAQRGLWGIENLAGIPGTVGASPVQNIGAYGSEVKDTIFEVEVIDAETRDVHILKNDACAFGYRDSRFKKERNLIIVRVSFLLDPNGRAQLGYKDLAAAAAEGVKHGTPEEVGAMVRTIRSRKFPDLTLVGTAGSFFKNPTISAEAYASLKDRYEEMPGFPNEHGVKIPLAFVLDRVLALRGYAEGNVSLFERQPLVLVAHEGATAHEIHTFADTIASRVHEEIGLHVEREVQSYPLENFS